MQGPNGIGAEVCVDVVRQSETTVNQGQLGQTLGMSSVSLNRAIQKIRRDGLADLRSGRLEILNVIRDLRQLRSIRGRPEHLRQPAPGSLHRFG